MPAGRVAYPTTRAPCPGRGRAPTLPLPAVLALRLVWCVSTQAWREATAVESLTEPPRPSPSVGSSQGGGFWGTPSGWVLPVIGRNSTLVAQQLVRDAVQDARANGINEWHNNDYCSNCAGEADTSTNIEGKCAAGQLGCQRYPISGNWLGGAMAYGPNIGSVYRAAVRLLSAD